MEGSLRVDTTVDNVGKSINNNEIEEELEPASPTSEYFLSEIAKMYILCIFELEIPINSSYIYDFFAHAFLECHPRFSCIPIDDKGRKMWKKVEVNAEDHIKTLTLPEGLTPEIYSEHLEDYMSKIATTKFDPHKPLWEVHTFNYPTKNATSTAIVKFHHAIGDGASLMGVVFTCFKRVDDPSLPLTFPTSTASTKNVKTTLMKTLNNVPKSISSFFYTVYDYVVFLWLTTAEDDCTPIRSGTTNMALPWSSKVCSVNLPLSEVKRIKSILKVTVNDVVIGIIALACRTYMREMKQGRIKKSRMTASIVVNLRSMKQYANPKEMREKNSWGNKLSMIELPLPNFKEDDLKNPLNFVMKAHKRMKRRRRGVVAISLTTWTLDLVRKLQGFKEAARAFQRGWKNTSFMVTSLIGPTDHMSIGNHPIKGFYFVPTGINLSLTVSVMSYMDNLRIGLVVENGFIDHQRLLTCVENAYQSIFQAATASTNSI